MNSGCAPSSDPVHLHDLHATILGLLGLDHTKLTYPYLGRDFRLTDVGGKTDLVEKLEEGLKLITRIAAGLADRIVCCRRSRPSPPSSCSEAATGWTQAAVKQDAAALQRFLADDLQYAHAGGQTQNERAVHRRRDQRARAIRVFHVQRCEGAVLRKGRGADRLRGCQDGRARQLSRPHTAGVYRKQRPVADGGPSVDPISQLSLTNQLKE